MAVPTAIYGSETWIVRKNHEARLQRTAMKGLEEQQDIRIQITNAIQTSEKELQFFLAVNIRTQNYINNWLQHL